MPRNPTTGAYTLPESPFQSQTTIQSAAMNSNLSDIATALTQSLASTGQTPMTGPIKAASGSVTAPSYAFSSATGTGFYLSGTNEFAWAAAGVLAATFGATGNVVWVGSHTIGGTLGVTGTISSAAVTAVATSTPITSRVSTNDTSEHTLVELKLGSGAGSTATIKAVGAGANDITTIRTYIGAAKITELTSTQFKIDSGIIALATAGYTELSEISAPAAPAADKIRLYAKDDGTGTTRPYVQGVTTEFVLLVPATQGQCETGTSLLVGVTPGTQKFNPAHPKAGGNFDGSGTPAFRAGDVGMGAITDGGAGIYTLNFDTAFADDTYWANSWARVSTADAGAFLTARSGSTKTTSAFQVICRRQSGGTSTDDDGTEIGITFWGDYA